MAGEHAEGAGKKGLQVAQGCQPGQRALRWVAASWTGEGALTRRAQLAVGACGPSTPRGLKRWRWGESGAMVSWAERARLVDDAREGGAGRAEADWAAGKEKGRVVLGLGYGSLFYFPFSFLFLLQTKFEFKSKFEFKPHSNKSMHQHECNTNF